MKRLLVLTLVLALAGAGIAADHDLGAVRPVKPGSPIAPPPPDPAVLRQGGDTIASATPLEIGNWVQFQGTTAGYTNDYDEVCPYSGSTSPDVVYTFTSAGTMAITVDMYGSQYDTKIYVYDQDLALVACNDDYYGDYTSRLENVPIAAGVQYYLIIDGYGGDYGNYTGEIVIYADCLAPCPDGAAHEGEPPLVDGYQDAWNGGCNSPQFGNPFQPITQSPFCGRPGYYLGGGGVASRDTDWFTVTIPAGGALEITAFAEAASYLFELGPQDCGAVGVVQSFAICPEEGVTMTVLGPAGATVWVWFGPQTFWSGETWDYAYRLELNLGPVAVADRSWSSVKRLFE